MKAANETVRTAVEVEVEPPELVNGAPGEEGASYPARVAEGMPEEPPPGTWFKRPVRLIASLRELWAFRELAMTLAERDIRVRYKQAALGVGWAVLGPLIMMGVFSFVFTKFTHSEAQGKPYALFAFLGLVPWTFFASSLTEGALSLTMNIPLLNKLYCPREVFPIAAILTALFDSLVALVVLAILFVITGQVPAAEIYWAPVLIAVLAAFTFGLTMAASVILVYMRDLRMVMPLVVQLGLFITPVAYGAHAVAKSDSTLIVYSALDPLVPVIDGFRRTILLGQAPQLVPLLVGAFSSLVVLVGGFTLFKRLETGIADVA